MLAWQVVTIGRWINIVLVRHRMSCTGRDESCTAVKDPGVRRHDVLSLQWDLWTQPPSDGTRSLSAVSA
jgi:hypothetical protein